MREARCEYFLHALRYDDESVYPGLVLPRGTGLVDDTLFYLGDHYAGMFVVAPQPLSWDLNELQLLDGGQLVRAIVRFAPRC